MGWNDNYLQVPTGPPASAAPSDNTNRTPNTQRPTLVTLYVQFAAGTATDDQSYTLTVGAHTFSMAARAVNERAATADTQAYCIGTFIVPANTTYKVQKTNNSGTPTATYNAEESTL